MSSVTVYGRHSPFSSFFAVCPMLLLSVGNIIIQGIINDFGSSVIAGYAASVKLNNLVITSLTTLGNGVSNFTAQNIGANKLPRVKEGLEKEIGITIFARSSR